MVTAHIHTCMIKSCNSDVVKGSVHRWLFGMYIIRMRMEEKLVRKAVVYNANAIQNKLFS